MDSINTPQVAISNNELGFIFIILIWDLIWKGIALWKAGKNKQRNWFIALLVINTIGLLPIIYLRFFSSTKKNLD